MCTPTTPNDSAPGRIIEAIAAGRAAWMSPAEVAEATGLDEEATLDELAELDVAGLLDVWDHPEGIAVTLSALAADRFGFRLVECGPKLQHRWARRGDPEPDQPVAYGVMRSASTASFDFLADPGPGPALEAERGEQAERYRETGLFGTVRKGAGRGEPPRPTMLIGSGMSPWPGPSAGETSRCPACASKALPPRAYCLCCDRWGLDAPVSAAPRPAGVARNPKSDGFRSPDQRIDDADRDRDRRRERRRMKMAERIQQQRRERFSDRGRQRSGPA